MPAALTNVIAVPIAKVGQWNASTGPWVCTREQLEDAVRASKDPTFRAPVLKLGHDDPRFNAEGLDGSPSIGRLTNLRLDASGDVLVADLMGVPTWLAEVMGSAYPSRSIEALLGVVTDTGQTYAMVCTGLALLGETPPAIESLGDIAALFEQPTAVEHWVAAKRLAAAIDPGANVTAPTPPPPARPPTDTPQVAPATQVGNTPAGGPSNMPGGVPDPAVAPGAARPGAPVRSSASLDQLMDQARAHAMANGAEGWVWAREVYTDHLILDDDAGRLWRMDWAEADGTFTFGALTPVQVTYTPVAASGVHAAWMPLRYARGRGDVQASTPKEQHPVTTTLAALRERLGLPDDATDQAVLDAAVARLAEQPETPAPPAAPTDTDVQQIVEARVAAAIAPLQQQLTSTSQELADRKERERVAARDALINGAVRAGKVKPADRESWTKQYDASPEGAAAVTSVMEALAPGSAVPVSAAGVVGGDAPGEDLLDSEWASYAQALGITERS